MPSVDPNAYLIGGSQGTMFVYPVVYFFYYYYV